jgi:subtilisin family serine protease
MKLITSVLLACLLLPSIAVSECAFPIRVAIIDTGFGFNNFGNTVDSSHLCQYGHRDFTDDQQFVNLGTVDPVPKDLHGHGTNIAGVIDEQLKGVYYCVVVLKYYNPHSDDASNLTNTIKAINYATASGFDFINYSGGGVGRSDDEIAAVKKYLDAGGIFVAAAGNENRDLDISHYYPAMDDPRVFVVGANGQNGKKLKHSNYGDRVNVWELGENVDGNGLRMTGTSQATAIATGKLVRAYDRNCTSTPDETPLFQFRSVANTEENSCH